MENGYERDQYFLNHPVWCIRPIHNQAHAECEQVAGGGVGPLLYWCHEEEKLKRIEYPERAVVTPEEAEARWAAYVREVENQARIIAGKPERLPTQPGAWL